MASSQEKIDAIFELRDAAEEKARAEKAVDDDPSPEKRDELLEKQIDLNAKTVAAISVCHECGHEHALGAPHFN